MRQWVSQYCVHSTVHTVLCTVLCAQYSAQYCVHSTVHTVLLLPRPLSVYYVLWLVMLNIWLFVLQLVCFLYPKENILNILAHAWHPVTSWPQILLYWECQFVSLIICIDLLFLLVLVHELHSLLNTKNITFFLVLALVPVDWENSENNLLLCAEHRQLKNMWKCLCVLNLGIHIFHKNYMDFLATT